jgi:Domain of unknown function (DUF4926)
MFEEHQCVKLRRPIPPMDKGAVGVVVMVYDFTERLGYEVEFVDREGFTLALMTLRGEDLEPAGSVEG